MTEIYWADFGTIRVAIMPRPRGGDWLEDELGRLSADHGVQILVSLLTPEENRELELSEEEAICSRDSWIEFVSCPIRDRGTPESMEAVRPVIARLGEAIREGKRVAFHCRNGLGRAPLIAACAIAAAGIPLKSALRKLSEARGWKVPETGEQLAWIHRFVETGWNA